MNIVSIHFKYKNMKKQPPFYQTGISAPQPKSGTTSFPTTKSRESKYTLKQLGRMAGDVAMSMLPIGRVLKAGKAASYLSKLNKKFPTGSQMKKHYDDVNKGIAQIKPTKQSIEYQRKNIVTKSKK